MDKIKIEVDSQLDQNVIVELTVGCPELGNLHTLVVCGWEWKIG